jgi:hypothetical protein
MLRAIGVVTLVGIGAMHFLQIVPTFEATPALGVAYGMFIAACLGVAAWLVTADDRDAWVAAALVCVAALIGYAFTRVLSTPFDNQDVGNWACMLGLAALFVESTMVALSIYALRAGTLARERALTPRTLPARPSARVVAERQAG